MTFQEEIEFNKRYLDTIDLSPYIQPYCDIGEIAYNIQARHRDPNMPEELEGYIFNFLSDEEIGAYLAERYGYKLRTQEVKVIYYLSID